MKWKQKIVVILSCLAVLLILVVMGNAFQRKYRQRYMVTSGSERKTEIQAEAETETEQEKEFSLEVCFGDEEYGTSDEIESYLVMGTDGSGGVDEEGQYVGAMADFLLLTVINHTSQTYGYLQLNRDTMTEVTLLLADGSGYASAQLQLCTAHWYGGDRSASCENTVEAVSYLLGGVPIDGYYALDMNAIPAINHEVGGVEVEIKDDFSDSDPTLVQGTKVRLNDEQAYHYIHDRMNVGDGENLSRMRRQKEYMAALLTQCRKKQEENQQFLPQMFQALNTYADTNLEMKKLVGLMKQTEGYQSDGIHTIEGETRLGQALDDGEDHTEFYVDEQSLKEQMIQLYHFIKL